MFNYCIFVGNPEKYKYWNNNYIIFASQNFLFTNSYNLGGSSKIIRKEFESHLKKYYRDSEHLWAIGYFIASVGEINGEIIAKYVEQQGKEEVEGEDIEL